MGSQKPAPIAAVVSKSGKKIFESGPLYVVKALPYYLVLRGQNYASLELSKTIQWATLYCIVFYLTQSYCFRAILSVSSGNGEGSYGQFYPNTT